MQLDKGSQEVPCDPHTLLCVCFRKPKYTLSTLCFKRFALLFQFEDEFSGD